MLNIPTDLLRTLVTVVDLRSFTKAAHSLGVSQPAVSAQVKRLQFLLGHELLDKSAPGVSLTSRGHEVVTAARRMLAINDEILRATGGVFGAETLRVGFSGDFAGMGIAPALARFRARRPHVPFSVNVTNFEHMLRDLKNGELDLAVTVAKSQPAIQARHLWLDQAVWVRSAATQINPHGPVPLVSFGEDCECRQLALEALNRVGRECDFVFASPGIASLEAAVVVGLGVMVLPRSRVAMTSLAVWDDAPLPPLPDLHCGIFLHEGDIGAELAELADEIAAVLRPQLRVADAAEPARAAGS